MNPRILIVEDEEALTLLLRYNLEAAGYEVETVARGDEADVRLREGNPDLVILDLTIAGGMGGTETLAALRGLDPGVRAIASSGYSTGALMADPLAHGFVGTLAKPYTMMELADAIAAARRRAPHGS